MAVLLPSVEAQLPKLFDYKVRLQINRRAPTFAWIPKTSYAGKAPSVRAFAGGRTAENFASGAAAGTADEDARLEGSEPWGRIRTQIEIAFDALIIALNAPNPAAAVTDLFAEEMDLAAKVLARKAETEVFSGTGGGNNQMMGLETAILDSGAYYGITDAAWQSAALGTAGTEAVMTLDDFAQFHTAIFNKSELELGSEDLWITTSANYDKYKALVGSNPRQLVNEGGTSLAAGATALEYDGVPVLRRTACTADRLYGIRRDSIDLLYLPVTQVNGMPVQGQRPAVSGSIADLDEPTDVMIHVNELGRVGNAIRYEVWMQVQLRVKDRFGHGVWRVKAA